MLMTIEELLEKYRAAEISERDKGAKFERLMKNFVLTDPAYRGKFSDVWLWNEFPFHIKFFGNFDVDAIFPFVNHFSGLKFVRLSVPSVEKSPLWS